MSALSFRNHNKQRQSEVQRILPESPVTRSSEINYPYKSKNYPPHVIFQRNNLIEKL